MRSSNLYVLALACAISCGSTSGVGEESPEPGGSGEGGAGGLEAGGVQPGGAPSIDGGGAYAGEYCHELEDWTRVYGLDELYDSSGCHTEPSLRCEPSSVCCVSFCSWPCVNDSDVCGTGVGCVFRDQCAPGGEMEYRGP